MANPTSNFGWQMPTATDLVTDLPADFEVFGQAVDTDFVDLLGGTTGQILSKASATDLDFTWINNDQGDITGVTAGTGITVTSPTGPVPTVSIDTSVTVDKTTAQTLTNKTLTSPALTTPTISTATTNGDLLYGTGSGALARLGIGSSAQVLTVSGGIPAWTTPAGGGGKVLQVVSTVYSTETEIASTTMTDSGITLSITPTLNTSKILVLMSVKSQIQRNTSNAGGSVQLLRGASAILSYTGGDIGWQFMSAGGASNTYMNGQFPIMYLDSPATTSSTTYKIQGRSEVTTNSGKIVFQHNSNPSTVILMEIGA